MDTCELWPICFFFCRFKPFKKLYFYKTIQWCLVVMAPSDCQGNPMVLVKWWIPGYFSLQIRIPHKNKLTRIEWFMQWNSKADFGLKLSANSVQNLRPCHIVSRIVGQPVRYGTIRDYSHPWCSWESFISLTSDFKKLFTTSRIYYLSLSFSL